MSTQKPEGCSGKCADCASDCAERDLRIPSGEFSEIKKVIGIVSGKGGVGKSLVTSLLACATQNMGFQTAVLDADVTGPSIPRAFGLKKGGESNEMGLLPVETRTGIRVMSVNLLLEKEDAPVVWRGPVISGVIQQFWKDVAWGTVDFLFVDMPPGTGDVALTVFQSLPVDGIIIVTTPQDLVTMIVKKAFRMAEMMNIPVLGLIENMSWLACPDCGRVIEVFGKSTVDAVAADLGVPVLAKLPIESRTAALIDTGAVELANTDAIAPAAEFLKTLLRG